MTPSLPRAQQIGSRQVAETLRKLAVEVGGLKAFEPGVREAIGNTNWTVLMQRLDEAVAALSRTAQAPVADGVAGELPDDLRAPLHSLEADIDWLVARIRAEDDEVVGVCKESIRNRLSQIEEASYRLSALASSDQTPATEAGGAAMLSASPLPSSSGTGWRPIETAPKDGTWVLAVRNGFIPETCCWQEDRWIIDEDQADDLTYNPDWWQTLPAAPVSHGGGRGE